VNTSSRHNLLLDISYRQRDALIDLVSDPRTLAIIEYGDSSVATEDNRMQVGTPPLAGGEYMEVWQTDQPIESGDFESIHYRMTDELLFGQVQVATSSADMEQITGDIYQQINKLQHALQFTHLVRIWNYMPWINREDDGMERYQAFCVGRHHAIDTSSGYEAHLPAATAVGTHNDHVLVYFLAARDEGTQIENPRQVSAFEYPEQYAPKSPAFSRAIVKAWGKQKHLYISGTASILGHESQHPDDPLRQLDECLNNIDILAREANRQTGIAICDTTELTGLKLYLRREQDLDSVLDHLRQRIGNEVTVMVLQADICRDDLLLEVEGIFTEV
jgi:chorismate lyase/3-hydroxybenzoate synthase